ncbi:MAG: ribosomal-protein-alanine N-acetyltransferase [Candidatus Azotimanducaceae bacterium]
MTVLHSERITAREFRLTDITYLRHYHANPLYLEHYDTPPDTEHIVQTAIAWSAELPRSNFQLAICLKNSDEPIGSIGLRGKGYLRNEAEIGIEVDPNHWGQGIAHEALGLVFDFAKSLGVVKLHSNTKVTNKRAQRLIESFGFSKYDAVGQSEIFSVSVNSPKANNTTRSLFRLLR